MTWWPHQRPCSSALYCCPWWRPPLEHLPLLPPEAGNSIGTFPRRHCLMSPLVLQVEFLYGCIWLVEPCLGAREAEKASLWFLPLSVGLVMWEILQTGRMYSRYWATVKAARQPKGKRTQGAKSLDFGVRWALVQDQLYSFSGVTLGQPFKPVSSCISYR